MCKRALIVCTVISIWAIQVLPSLFALDVNAPLPITRRVTVQPIIVSNSDGSNSAEWLGNATQQADIKGIVDTVWAQAGIDVEWFEPKLWNNTTANLGQHSSLTEFLNSGSSAGVTNPDPLVLNSYFVEITPGGTDNGENFINGIARVGGNGISQAVGDSLVNSSSGRELIANIVSHEIAHNLGLNHVTVNQNLLNLNGSGERLDASQINTVLASRFSLPYSPLPGDFSGDGWVDHADLSLWRNGFGIGSDAAPTDGDADRDGDVDSYDFLEWQRAYGNHSTVSALSIAPVPTVVPEPSSLVLVGMVLLLLRQKKGVRNE